MAVDGLARRPGLRLVPRVAVAPVSALTRALLRQPPYQLVRWLLAAHVYDWRVCLDCGLAWPLWEACPRCEEAPAEAPAKEVVR